MKLCPPQVKGPISKCNKLIRVCGHLAGSTVSILINGAVDPSSTKLSNWPDDVFKIGVSINAGDEITAIQEFNGDKSEASPMPMIVQDTPSELSSLTILTHIHECGRALAVKGAVPGSELKILMGQNVEAGKATSTDGTARITYKPPLKLHKKLVVQESTCNNLTGFTNSGMAEELPSKLPTPVIHTPLIECDTSLKTSNIVEGATITLERYEGGILKEELSTISDTTGGSWIALKPLKKGQEIKVWQAFACGEDPSKFTLQSEKASATVHPVSEITAPKVIPPLCENGQIVTIAELKPGARVLIYQEDELIGIADAPDSISPFYVPKLVHDTKIKARMQLCNTDGPFSDKVPVEKNKEFIDLIAATMYECAAYICVMYSNVDQPFSSLTYITNKQGYMISDYQQVFSSAYTLIPVSPSLVAGDEIWVHAIACGGVERKFGPYEVKPIGKLDKPDFTNLPQTEGSTVISVLSYVAGAVVTFYIDDLFAGQTISKGIQEITYLSLQKPLQLGQEIKAYHILCDQKSDAALTTVVIPYPKKPKLIKPAAGEMDVSVSPHFDWEDPGINTDARATSYTLRVYKEYVELFSIVSVVPSGGDGSDINLEQFPALTLQYDTYYEWTVEPENSTGKSWSGYSQFRTMSKPTTGGGQPGGPTQAAFLKLSPNGAYPSLDKVTQLYPVPAWEEFFICIEVANIGNASSQSFQIIFELHVSATGHLIDQHTVDFPSFGVGQSDIAFASVPGLQEAQYYFNIYLVVNNSIVESTYYGIWVGF